MSETAKRLCVMCARFRVRPSEPALEVEFYEVPPGGRPLEIGCGIFAWQHRNETDEVEDLRHNMQRAASCDSFDPVIP